MTEKFNHEMWFLYYPEEGNKGGGGGAQIEWVYFGIEKKDQKIKSLSAKSGYNA